MVLEDRLMSLRLPGTSLTYPLSECVWAAPHGLRGVKQVSLPDQAEVADDQGIAHTRERRRK